MTTEFETFSEEKKIQKAFERAFMDYQSSLSDPFTMDRSIVELYAAELRAMIDRLVIKLEEERIGYY